METLQIQPFFRFWATDFSMGMWVQDDPAGREYSFPSTAEADLSLIYYQHK